MYRPKGRKHTIPPTPQPSATGRIHTMVVGGNLWVSMLFSAVEKIDVGSLPDITVAEVLAEGTIYRPNLTTYSTGLANNAGSVFIGGGTGVTVIDEATGVLLNKFAQVEQFYAGCLLVEDGGIYVPVPFYGGLRKYDFSGNVLIDAALLTPPKFGNPVTSFLSDGSFIYIAVNPANKLTKLNFNLTLDTEVQTTGNKPIGIAFDGTSIWVSFQGSPVQPFVANGGLLKK
jgi:hypothetical protein